jgi:hypothetical protein
MDICFQKQKVGLFIAYTTHFRMIQSFKYLNFHDKSLHSCHSLLKINNKQNSFFFSETILESFIYKFLQI